MDTIEFVCNVELPIPSSDSEYKSFESFDVLAKVEVASGVEYYAGRYIEEYTDCSIDSIALTDASKEAVSISVLDKDTKQYIIDMACEMLDNR